MARAASAQLSADQVPAGRVVPANEGLRQELEQSRYHIGAIRVQPLLSLRDFGYHGNVFGVGDNTTNDWRATFGGGARFIVPAGPKTYLRASALPEYTWYRKLSDRRAFGGNYGASLLFLLNRMPIEAGVNQIRSVARVSSEEERSVLQTQTNAFVNVEVEIFKRLSLLTSVQSVRPRYSITDADRAAGAQLDSLERTDSAALVALRYRFRPHVTIGVGEEAGRTRFVKNSINDNHSRATMLLLGYDMRRTYLNLALSTRKVEADDARSSLQDAKTATGSYTLVHQFNVPIRVTLNGRRNLTYSLFTSNAYFIETRNGASLSMPVGKRMALMVSGETGDNDYLVPVRVASRDVKRSDKANTFGGGFSIQLYPHVAFVATGSSTKYTSNIPGYDRTIVRVATNIDFSFSKEFFK